MSGQSPRVADAALAFVGGHLPSDGEQVGQGLPAPAPGAGGEAGWLHHGPAGQWLAVGAQHRL